VFFDCLWFYNHLAAENLKGHSFIGRLSEEEEKLVVNMSKTLVGPRDILHTLKHRNNLNGEYIEDNLQCKKEA